MTLLVRLFPPNEPLERRRRLFLVAMTTPVVLYALLFMVYPALLGLNYSLYRYNLMRPSRTAFVGVDNYLKLWTDPTTAHAVLNTLIFMAAAVSVEFVLGFALALLLWPDGRFNRACLALLLIPATVTPLAVGLMFRGLLTPDYGPLGYWARIWGLSSEHGFLGSPGTALGTIVAMDVWQWTPIMALILLAGLKAIPASVLEAAEIDGATPWQRLTTVIVPVMVPSILLALLLRLIDASMIFDTIYVTTAGGPNDATEVLMIRAVKQGLEFLDIGAASATAASLLAIVGVLGTAFFVLVGRTDRKMAS